MVYKHVFLDTITRYVNTAKLQIIKNQFVMVLLCLIFPQIQRLAWFCIACRVAVVVLPPFEVCTPGICTGYFSLKDNNLKQRN